MNSRNFILAITPLALACAPVFAAQRVELVSQDLGKLKQQYNSVTAQSGVPAMTHARHARLLGLDTESHLVLKTRKTDLGARNSRYKQTFRGIPIFGESVVVSEDAASGQARALFGHKIAGLASEISSITPKISKADAIGAGKRAALGGRTRVRNAQAELNIYVDRSGRASLAYVVQFFADSQTGGNPTLPNVIVDANTGRILEQWENLQHADGTGPGGNEKTGQYEYGTDYDYLDVTQSGTSCSLENANVKTVDLNHASGDIDVDAFAAHKYTCPRNTVKSINGAYSPLNDAHYFGGVVFNMYQAYMGAAPLPEKLKMAVHYGTNYENASYDRLTNTMLFGDGKDKFYPLTALDVTSHEVSHGYTNHNSGLIYDKYDSGALNEAYSDIAGEAAEYYVKGSNDFLVGADIMKSGVALRYFAEPRKDGRSLDHVNQMPAKGIDNHQSSGIYNKAFYTLATTPGWNTKTAFQVFARANRDYWTENTSFNAGGAGVLRAACDMGMKGQDVVNAFKPVGIDPGQVGSLCSDATSAPAANFTYTAQGQMARFTDGSKDPDGSIVSRSWDFGDGTTSTETNPVKLYSAAGTYRVTLTVKDNQGLSHSRFDYILLTPNVLTNGAPWNNLYGGDLPFSMNVYQGARDIRIAASGGTGTYDLYVKLGEAPTTTSYTCRSTGAGAKSCVIASAPNGGKVYVLLKGSYSGVSLVGSFTYPSDITKIERLAIPDAGEATSTLSVSQSPSGDKIKYFASVSVNIDHTFIGDLKVDLISPTGKVQTVHNRTGGSTDNLRLVDVPVNMLGEPTNGNWKLRMSDGKLQDTGALTRWELKYH